MNPADEKKYVFNRPDTVIDGRVFVTTELEKILSVEDKKVIVVQKRHIATSGRWISVVGYILSESNRCGAKEYTIQPIIHEFEMQKIKQAIFADSSLDKTVEISSSWGKYTKL